MRDVVAQRAVEHVVERRELLREIHHLGVSICRRENASNCRVRLSPRLGRVHDHVEQAPVFLRSQVAPQALGAAADDHQQVVEVVRHAAGDLSDRLQPLGLPQCRLRCLAPLGFVVKAARAPQRDGEDEQDEQRRRQPVDRDGSPWSRSTRFGSPRWRCRRSRTRESPRACESRSVARPHRSANGPCGSRAPTLALVPSPGRDRRPAGGRAIADSGRETCRPRG